MNSNNAIYGVRSNGLNHGDVFTSLEVVKFMLDTMGYTAQIDLSNIFILEPSFGNGDFLVEIQHRIIESSKKFNFKPNEAFQRCVFGCEIDKDKFDICISRLRILMPDFSTSNLRNEDFLFSNWNCTFDFVVGNPPYIRYENIPSEVRNIYKANFQSFHYRCDLYVLFYEHSLALLKPYGNHCFICSNRWLRNEYGKKLRYLINRNYHLDKIIDVEKINAFQESVLAYPAITVIVNRPNKHVVELAVVEKLQDLNTNIQYKQKKYPEIDDLSIIFHKDQYSEFPTIEEQNFSIGIGVATGADRIFISKDLVNKIEYELLLPIICAKDLSGNRFQYNGLCLLNPYDKFGKLIDLDNFPKAKSYLEQFKTKLQNRHIVKNNRQWYSLIDKVKLDLQHKSKILLPDISANSYVFVDRGNYYPSHNIYYIISKHGDNEQLSLLAAILMSDAVKEQLLNLSNKMNGGFPRWQSQVLRKLRIPYICDINKTIRNKLLLAYQNFDLSTINNIVSELFNSPTTYSKHKKKTYNQLSLFDSPALFDIS